MTDNDRHIDDVQKEYEKLVSEIKKELPNIVLPSMGMLDDSIIIDIDGKNFIVNDNFKEE